MRKNKKVTEKQRLRAFNQLNNEMGFNSSHWGKTPKRRMSKKRMLIGLKFFEEQLEKSHNEVKNDPMYVGNFEFDTSFKAGIMRRLFPLSTKYNWKRIK